VAVLCEQVELSGYTTLRLGGPASRFVEAATEEDLLAAVRAADSAGEPLLVLGGGSNLVVGDAGFPGTVVRVATRGVERLSRASDTGVRVRVQAGEEWESFVARCVAEGLSGVECLSGIPGRIGATPIQNVGAYGQDVAETIVEVRAYDRERGETITLDHAACDFTYRNSVFKVAPDRYVVLEVTFALGDAEESQPIRYAELARTLGVEPGERVPLSAAERPYQDLRGLAHRARGLRQGPCPRPGADLRQAHPRAHQPRRREYRRPAGPGQTGAGRGTRGLRRRARQRTGLRRRHSLTRHFSPLWAR
jgi:UDP-N-acetylmuramate dehydrogenase